MSFHKKFCNWASQKKININKVTYKRAENAFIDTLACILSGVQEKQSKVALKYCLENNNSGKIMVFGGGKKLSISAACFLHGVRAASIDFDDYEYVAGSHPSAPIFSALISIAQMKNISIEETYQGWLVGYELIIKLGQALSYDHYYKGWHSANTIGVVGTAAAVSKVLKLNADQMANAISIATSFSSGLKQQFGTDIKAFHIGFASQAGVQSALLAKNGGTANQDIWNIERGFIELYGSKFSKKLNNNFKRSDLGNAIIKFPNFIKFWPVCSYSQRVIQGGLILNKKIFIKNKILTPNYFTYSFDKSNLELKKLIKKKIGFPVVIKPINEGSSVNVFICNQSNLKNKINLPMKVFSFPVNKTEPLLTKTFVSAIKFLLYL